MIIDTSTKEEGMGEVLFTTLIQMGLMKLMWITLLLLLLWLPSVVYSVRLGEQKGTPVLGLLKGVIFGPLGVILLVRQPSKKKV
ncbi:hypothetical protein [Shewanella surugensis]|uniref:Uncharacterized protein n=1 Tax=Shewanella surugensis TaxID=212020 RepID=A0ABT0LI07_9GAMM|nr:hypothetical protein [Shewanella surugensis]MCL1127339.1 hypothetical protein [Shewanella surugensis]